LIVNQGGFHLGRAVAGVFVAAACLALLQGYFQQPVPTTVLAQPNTMAPVARSGGVGQPAPPRQEWEIFPLRQAVVPVGRQSVLVPILMYHYIRINPDFRDQLGFNLSVTPQDFRQQMEWLDSNGYHPVDFNDLRGYLAGHNPLPSRPIVLTFDDGYTDVYTEAYPVLRQHKFKAVSYVVSGFVNTPRYVSSEQLVDMDRNGIQLGSHTIGHVNLVKTTGANRSRELKESKANLERLVGHPVLDFCYPSGMFDSSVVQAVQEAGYESATTTAPGTRHALGDRYTWTRVRVSGGERLDQFIRDLGPEEPSVVTLVERAQVKRAATDPVPPQTFPLVAPSANRETVNR
jgi:peptidoglycan/xylan/chitin deacetylase (PgdA/CDA1 family)